jgi:hypothetical protein
VAFTTKRDDGRRLDAERVKYMESDLGDSTGPGFQ